MFNWIRRLARKQASELLDDHKAMERIRKLEDSISDIHNKLKELKKYENIAKLLQYKNTGEEFRGLSGLLVGPNLYKEISRGPTIKIGDKVIYAHQDEEKIKVEKIKAN